MPDPPLKHLPPPIKKRGIRYVSSDDDDDNNNNNNNSQKIKQEGNGKSSTTTNTNSRPKIKGGLTGLSAYLPHFERTTPPERKLGPTPASTKASKRKKKLTQNEKKLEPIISAYRKEQLDCGGEYEGMNCYNTLFVGRLAYEVTERKLLREFEVFGPVKDLKIVYDTAAASSGENGKGEEAGNGGGEKKSRGYAFVEYEHEDDMKRAYRNADGMRVEGRCVVVDVERGHTVLNWLPRRLGGGLGGTRVGGKDKNVTAPGRFDPSKPEAPPPQHPMGMGGGPPHGGPPGPGGPPPGYGGGMGGPGGPPGPGYHPHPMMRGGGRGGPPPGPHGYGGPPPGYGGGPPPGYGGGPYGPPRGGGGPYGGPPRGGGDYYGGGGPGGGPGGMKRRRSRSRSPERRRGRY
uniref:U1 small nuclear ribonucleoprotein 70 kDa n=1 Tax=Helicotheca tamesis TaxID=374047 RepID=A0A7S2MHC8_9STRA